MTKENTLQSQTKILSVIPTDKLYNIHDNLRKYHNKWDKNQVVELVDTSVIENFYSLIQYCNQTVPIVGAGLVASGYIEAGVITAGISLYADYLITRGKEKLFKSEEKKQKSAQFSQDLDNIYDHYEELAYILQPLHSNNSLPELNKLINSLQKKLSKIKEENEFAEDNFWERKLSYIFWSLRKDESSNIKELVLLNNGLKASKFWTEIPLTFKIKCELSRLFLSLRKSNPLWTEWEYEWEKRRIEHQKVQHLVEILQIAISENQQDISSTEIEKNIKINRVRLEVVRLYQKLILLNSEISEKIKSAFANYSKKTALNEKELKNLREQQYQIGVSPKGNN